MIKKIIALIIAGYGLWVVALKLMEASKGQLELGNFLIGFIFLVGGGYWFYKLINTAKK